MGKIWHQLSYWLEPIGDKLVNGISKDVSKISWNTYVGSQLPYELQSAMVFSHGRW